VEGCIFDRKLLTNISPKKCVIKNKTSCELWYGRQPNLSCKAHVFVQISCECNFLGYSEEFKVRCFMYSHDKKYIVIFLNVIFHKNFDNYQENKYLHEKEEKKKNHYFVLTL
jgi:hypothetical protein